MTKKITVVQRVKNIVLMGIGSVIAAAGLDVFLVPNNIIDVIRYTFCEILLANL